MPAGRAACAPGPAAPRYAPPAEYSEVLMNSAPPQERKQYGSYTNNNTPDRNAPEGTAAPDAAAKPEKSRRRPNPRRRPARRPAQEQSDGLWSGSRDILGSPEIRLNEQTAPVADAPAADAPSAAPAPDADASAGKKPGRQPSRQPGRRPDAPREPASRRTEQACRRGDRHRRSQAARRGTRQRHPRAAVASPPRRSRYPMRRTRIARRARRARH